MHELLIFLLHDSNCGYFNALMNNFKRTIHVLQGMLFGEERYRIVGIFGGIKFWRIANFQWLANFNLVN